MSHLPDNQLNYLVTISLYIKVNYSWTENAWFKFKCLVCKWDPWMQVHRRGVLMRGTSDDVILFKAVIALAFSFPRTRLGTKSHSFKEFSKRYSELFARYNASIRLHLKNVKNQNSFRITERCCLHKNA